MGSTNFAVKRFGAGKFFTPKFLHEYYNIIVFTIVFGLFGAGRLCRWALVLCKNKSTKGILQMRIEELKNSIAAGNFDRDFELLYNEHEQARTRYTGAADRFAELYGEGEGARLFSAPGRTEVGGNHTDHQHGCVLAGSVNLDVIAVAAPNNEGVVRIKSHGFEMDEIDLNTLTPVAAENGKAAALIRGMCAFFKQEGYQIGGFNAYTTSNVLKGSGLSSSAAFEVLVGVILNSLYNGGTAASAVTIAKLAQKAENQFFGKPCGLMDQMASSVGGFTAIDFNDPADPIIEKVSFDLAAHGHSLCIVNTGGNHADLTEDYAAITRQCKQVSKALGKEFLREVDESAFYGSIAALRDEFGDRAVLRSMHFFADNKRAVAEKQALQRDDFNAFLKLITESGNSSFKYLQNVFSVSAPEEQGLSLALALTERYLNGLGACRVHGGGFAGTIQAFVPTNMLAGYKEMIEDVFGRGNCHVLNIRPVGGYALTGK